MVCNHFKDKIKKVIPISLLILSLVINSTDLTFDYFTYSHVHFKRSMKHVSVMSDKVSE